MVDLAQRMMVFVVGAFLLLLTATYLPDSYTSIAFGQGSSQHYPFTIQNFMWITFLIGLSDIFMRFQAGRINRQHFSFDYLLIKEKEFIEFDDMERIRNNAQIVAQESGAYLPVLIKHTAEQLKTNHSLQHAVAVLNSFMDLLSEQLGLNYGRLRYLFWLIPTLGFIGTVFGISQTVRVVGQSNPEDPMLLANLAGNLALAFDTTLLALSQSALLFFLMNSAEMKEEKELNRAGEFILQNLINRLK